MKRLFTGNDNRIKRRVSAVMAGVIVLTTIGSVTYLKQRTVQAKETLYSIERVLDDLKVKKSAYNILEIVPDKVSGNVVLDYVSDNIAGSLSIGITQYPGYIGYYVGGSEPLRDDVYDIVNEPHIVSFKDFNAYESTLDDSSVRYKTVEAVYDAVKNSAAYDEDRGPFSLKTGYSEIRQGEYIGTGDESGYIISDEALENAFSRKELGRIIRESDHIDNARGIMKCIEAGDENAHYVLKYITDMKEGIVDADDPAFILMSEYEDYCRNEGLSENNIYFDTNENFIINSVVSDNVVDDNDEEEVDLSDSENDEDNEILWQFDPYLILPEDTSGIDDSEGAEIYAVFAPLFGEQLSVNKISSGYRVVDSTPVDKDKLPEYGTPVYRLNSETGRYEYYRNCDEEFIRELTSTDNTDGTDDNSESTDADNIRITSDEILKDTANAEKKDTAAINSINKDAIADEISEGKEGIKDEIKQDQIVFADELQMPDEIGADVDDISSEDEVEDLSDNSIDLVSDNVEENFAEDSDPEFYTLTFAYFDDYQKNDNDPDEEDTGFYGVKAFKFTDRFHGAQYILPEDQGLLVPNLMNNGVISVREDKIYDNLLYEYNRNSSLCNLRWSGNEESDKTYRITGAKIYYDCGIENKEWFKRFVFDRDCYPYDVDDENDDTAEELTVKVIRKTASEVEQADIIGMASSGAYINRMIVLMAGDGSYCVDGADYEQYAARVRDISPDVYTQILYRAYKSKDRVPVIVDHSIIDNERKLSANERDSLMYNLAYALSYKDASEYSSYVYANSNNIESGRLANTELSAVKYASDHSCEVLNGNGGDFVNGNIYMYNRISGNTLLNILNKQFNEEFSRGTINDGFLEVEEDIEREKKFRDADYSLKDKPLTNDKVTEATVIRYIIGNGTARSNEGKGEITVLEIEPTNCYDLTLEEPAYEISTADDELAIKDNDEYRVYKGKLSYKNKDLAPIINQKGLKINLKQMTTAEFVGHVEDLNATYDLIYIGMNTGYTGESEGMEQVGDWWTDTFDRRIFEDYGNPALYNDTKLGLVWEFKDFYGAPDWYSLDEAWKDGFLYQRRRYSGNNDFRIRRLRPIPKSNYGGFHHRQVKPEDISQGRALASDVIMTDFNDDNMDGLVYCNVGDITYISETVGGSLKICQNPDASDEDKTFTWPEYVGEQRYLSIEDEKNHKETDSTHVKAYDQITVSNSSDLGYGGNYSLYRTRYSGNDITKDNMRALIDYSKAGYPIVLADGFYSDYDVNTRKGTINTCAVDNSSYMYEAVKTINDESSDKNLFKQSFVPADLFNWYVLNLGKPTIEMTDETCKEAQKSTVYLTEDQKTGDGHYNAYFKFKIDSMGSSGAGTKYNIGLFIDINADGKYSKTSEGISFSSLRDYNTSATISPTGTDPETNMPIYSLDSGHEYEARCKLSGSFVGCLPWRLCVSQIGNPYRRNNADGYYAVRNNEKRVKVLQIRQNNGYTWNMKEDYDSKGDFYKLVTDTAYMPFKITGKDKKVEGSDAITYDEGPDSITVSEFENIVEDDEKTPEGYYKYLSKNYDMVILGFADVYHGPNMKAAEGIKKYIENGYSVLFTHDCTSFVNSYSSAWYRNAKTLGGDDVTLLGDNWGYEFNSLIRNIVGMDRYDVLAESKHENEKPYKPRSERNKDTILDYEKHGFTYHILNHWGYQNADNIAADGRQPRNLWENNNHDKTFLKYTNLVGVSVGNGQYDEPNYVTQVNKGQITQYPYVLDEEFTVAKTHSQYYQLDLTADDDNDGESDIVVWYCISRIGSPGDSVYDVNMYNISPNDVRNNYYIYNKGNVTYSGVGHSKPTGENELKLFINTMIASFRTGLHEPDLAVVDSYKDNPSKVRQLYVSYDDEIRKAVVSGNTIAVSGETDKVNVGSATDETVVNKNSDIDNTVDMYFNAEQVSLVQNASSIDHGLYARVFFKDDSAEHTIGYYCGDEYVDETYKNIKVSPIDLTGRVFAQDSDTAEEVISGRTNTTISSNGVVINEEFMNGCVKVGNGVTYKVKVPVTDNMLWGGSNKTSLGEVGKSREIYVVTRDYASYKNVNGEIYKVSLTDWALDKVGLARVEVFDLD